MAKQSSQVQITRRKFLANVVGAIGGVIAAVVAVPLIGYFLSPTWGKSKPLLTPIALTRIALTTGISKGRYSNVLATMVDLILMVTFLAAPHHDHWTGWHSQLRMILSW